MKDSRAGETLWREWVGEGYLQTKDPATVFFTIEHVDVEHEVVRRALASALQRDGSVISLGQGFSVIDDAQIVIGYAGEIEGERELTVCDEHGETPYGDTVDKVLPITWVELECHAG